MPCPLCEWNRRSGWIDSKRRRCPSCGLLSGDRNRLTFTQPYSLDNFPQHIERWLIQEAARRAVSALPN